MSNVKVLCIDSRYIADTYYVAGERYGITDSQLATYAAYFLLAGSPEAAAWTTAQVAEHDRRRAVEAEARGEPVPLTAPEQVEAEREQAREDRAVARGVRAAEAAADTARENRAQVRAAREEAKAAVAEEVPVERGITAQDFAYEPVGGMTEEQDEAGGFTVPERTVRRTAHDPGAR